MNTDEMVLGPKSDNFAFETTVIDHLMSQNEDVILDYILGREPNISHEIGEVQIFIDWSFFNKFLKLMKRGRQNI